MHENKICSELGAQSEVAAVGRLERFGSICALGFDLQRGEGTPQETAPSFSCPFQVISLGNAGLENDNPSVDCLKLQRSEVGSGMLPEGGTESFPG